MVKLASHQTPWLIDALEIREDGDWKSAFAKIIADRAHARMLRTLVIVAGGDHGYWREERIYEDAHGLFWWEHDTHRASSAEPRAITRTMATDVIALASSSVDDLSPLGNVVAFWSSASGAQIVKSDSTSNRILTRLSQP
jgi:hypothetical protein